ncbi:unnamed protein product [Brassica oleracea var. botrytis]|nr:unnamed protein product [Brassica oleracea]
MEGLIPFLYKAVVMYKREGSFSSALLSDHHSPSTSGYYMRLPDDSSGRFRTSDLRRFGTDRHIKFSKMENKRSYYAILIPTLWTVWLACVGQSCARHPKVKPPMPGPPRCPNCGPMVVPYPLSTGPNCGDQAYKINCVGGKLYFGALHGSSYLITSINPVTQRIVIHPPGFASSGSCLSADVSKAGLELDPHLPFSITNSNTILLLGCPEAMLQAPIDCTGTSLCHSYIKSNVSACSKAPFCCTFRTDGSQNAYTIRINGGGCLAYQSFVGLNPNKEVPPPGKKWPDPGLELQWTLPKEPVCKTDVDCSLLLGTKSKCLPDTTSLGLKRCFCKKGLEWDPVSSTCGKCRHGKLCKKKKKSTVVFAGAAVAVVVFTLAIAVAVLANKHSHKRVKKEIHKNIVKERQEMLSAKSTGKSSRIFTGREITKATNNFSKDNLIGTGGFGEVFKAVLDDGTITAIKRAKLNNTKGTDQILNEVRILCQVNHRSLVRLLGCCVDLELPLLIYEFIPNGTLFEHLHGNSDRSWKPLSWRRRLQIAYQTAEGLAYLHSSAMPPIYHRDVKSSNILLDDKLNAKVSDFGLSRLVDLTETANNESHIFTGAQGTLGYVDPEYYRNFQLTDKSDVYSFGVVLLEIVTSKKAIDFSRQEEDVNLVMYMNKMMDEERLVECIDPVLKKTANKVDLQTMQQLGNLASACLNERRQNRPSMKEVADEIEYIINVLSQESPRILPKMSLTTVFRRASSRVATLAFRSVRSPLAVRSGSERLILGSQQLSRASAIPFSTESAVTKTTADENLVSVLESEIDCAVKEEAPDQNLMEDVPQGFPFKIIDTPGERTVLLQRNFEDETIQVEVDSSAPYDDEEQEQAEGNDDEDEEHSVKIRIPMVVSVSKGDGVCLEFGVSAYPDEIVIDSLSIKHPQGSDSELAYQGPDFDDLDENLQKAFHRFLEIRGIKPSFTDFLADYVANKDSREYLQWLKDVKSFVDK